MKINHFWTPSGLGKSKLITIGKKCMIREIKTSIILWCVNIFAWSSTKPLSHVLCLQKSGSSSLTHVSWKLSLSPSRLVPGLCPSLVREVSVLGKHVLVYFPTSNSCGPQHFLPTGAGWRVSGTVSLNPHSRSRGPWRWLEWLWVLPRGAGQTLRNLDLFLT